MRILQVSTADIAGGAERVAMSLFEGYRCLGHDSWLAVGLKRSSASDVLVVPNVKSRGLWGRLLLNIAAKLRLRAGGDEGGHRALRVLECLTNPIRWVQHQLGYEDFSFPGTWQLLDLTPQYADVVHCHNLHGPIVPGGGYFDLRVLPWLSQQVPVFLTLHDAWLLSGHCCHPFDCDYWKTGCGHCSDLTIYPAIRRDATAYNWRRKQKIYDRSRLHVATPCRWLMQKIGESMMAPAIRNARVIPNGVDVSIFNLGDQLGARATMGIAPDSNVLLFVGNMTRSSRWKDYPTLESAVQRVAEGLPERSLILICLGEKGETERIGRAEVWFVGYQQEPAIVAQYYLAADVYVHSARADTFPNTVLEALACGTPVVATGVGGIPEQIEDGVTGFLVNPGDAVHMADRIKQLLSDDDLRKQMGVQAAEDAHRRFNVKRQVEDYLDWYLEIFENWQCRTV